MTIAPGGSTGWHSHPGPAVVIVKSGSLTLYDGDDRRCIGTAYTANPATPAVGKVFIDEGRGHVHIGRNEGSTNTELYVTYLDVPVGAAPRIDVPRPGQLPLLSIGGPVAANAATGPRQLRCARQSARRR